MNLLPSRVPLPLDTVTHADALTFLRGLPDNTVNCCITSPPYFGLRSYLPNDHPDKHLEIGLEDTPAAFVAKMVELFREVRRVLRPDGTCWVNLGDSYTTRLAGDGWGDYEWKTGGKVAPADGTISTVKRSQSDIGLPPKNLLMIPARVAIALQDDGWVLRSEIVWHKPNPLPESVTDRCTKSHEMVYMLAKRGDYWYDADAIREKPTTDTDISVYEGARRHDDLEKRGLSQDTGWKGGVSHPAGRNRRSVWSIATEPSNWDYCSACGRFYEGTQRNLIHVEKKMIDGREVVFRHCVCGRCDAWVGHFAAYPEALIEPCILSGCPHKVCTVCGASWVRVVEKPDMSQRPTRGDSSKMNTDAVHISNNWQGVPKSAGQKYQEWRNANPDITLGFAPTCAHTDAPTRPGIVLDPFMGSGTTGLVARRLGRHYMGSELNAEYVALARERLAVPFTLPMFEMLEVTA